MLELLGADELESCGAQCLVCLNAELEHASGRVLCVHLRCCGYKQVICSYCLARLGARDAHDRVRALSELKCPLRHPIQLETASYVFVDPCAGCKRDFVCMDRLECSRLGTNVAGYVCEHTVGKGKYCSLTCYVRALHARYTVQVQLPEQLYREIAPSARGVPSVMLDSFIEKAKKYITRQKRRLNLPPNNPRPENVVYATNVLDEIFGGDVR